MLHRIWLGFFLLAFICGLGQWLFAGDADVFQRMVSALFEMATLAVELAPKIRVNAVGPGPVSTPNFHQSTGLSETQVAPEAGALGVPLGRIGRPEDIGAAVVFSSGFAEMGDSGRAEQLRLRALARASGMRILGPNCLGLYNAAIGLFATFSSTVELGTPRAGPVGVVSQSGAFGGHFAYLARQRGIEVGTLLTTGNECDVEMAEGIAWMAMNDDVNVIAAVAEGPRDGDSLIEALELARAARKPVVFLKMGRSAIGASSSRSNP